MILKNTINFELMESLIQERNEFEQYIYEFLVTPIISDSFWEPVKVVLPDHCKNKLIQVYGQSECIICRFDKLFFRELSCCKNKMCSCCINKWFNESVKCPFCKHDLRTKI